MLINTWIILVKRKLSYCWSLCYTWWL